MKKPFLIKKRRLRIYRDRRNHSSPRWEAQASFFPLPPDPVCWPGTQTQRPGAPPRRVCTASRSDGPHHRRGAPVLTRFRHAAFPVEGRRPSPLSSWPLVRAPPCALSPAAPHAPFPTELACACRGGRALCAVACPFLQAWAEIKAKQLMPLLRRWLC